MKKRGFLLLCIGICLFSCTSSTKKEVQRIVYLACNDGAIHLKRGLTSYYTITLRELPQKAFVFYMHPLEDVEEVYIDRFVDYWKSANSSLKSGAKGAAVVVATEKGMSFPFLFMVQDPIYNGEKGTLTFDAHASVPIEEIVLKQLQGKLTLMIESDR